jgi:hypothetical protein
MLAESARGRRAAVPEGNHLPFGVIVFLTIRGRRRDAVHSAAYRALSKSLYSWKASGVTNGRKLL